MLIRAFARARQVMNECWFAPIIFPEFTPGVTTVTFPEGYRATLTMYFPTLNHPTAVPVIAFLGRRIRPGNQNGLIFFMLFSKSIDYTV